MKEAGIFNADSGYYPMRNNDGSIESYSSK